MQWWDNPVPVEKLWKTVENFVENGKVDRGEGLR
jgi:hypothetical protein